MRIHTNKLVYLNFFSMLFLLIFSSVGAYANAFIADTIGRPLETMRFSMSPGIHAKEPILPGNKKNVGGVLVMDFYEQDDYFGFSALICDEKNADLYEKKKRAECFRKEIDLKSDVLKFRFRGDRKYFLFIVNRTKPVSIVRNITVKTYMHTQLNKQVRKEFKTELEKLNAEFKLFFDIEPWQFGVVPCQRKYIPSKISSRTITICSEFSLSRDATPDYEMMKASIFYEMSPFFEKHWEMKELKTEKQRLQFMVMMMSIFNKTSDPYTRFVDLHEYITDVDKIIRQYPHYDEEFDHEKRIEALINISNNLFSMMDVWLEIAYQNMTNQILEEIRDGQYRHYGFLRNTARIILKRRHEQKLREENPDMFDDDEKNIISDFW